MSQIERAKIESIIAELAHDCIAECHRAVFRHHAEYVRTGVSAADYGTAFGEIIARHLSALTQPSPNPTAARGYASLREANIARQAAWCPDQVPDLSFRGNELAGETGEVCNVIKKLERERLGWRGSRDTVEHLAEELADVVICADLVALSAGIDLDDAVVAKFNATSEKVGLPHRLSASRPSIGEPVPGAGWWQPIETAPKNRKVLVAYRNALGNWRIVTATYHTELPWGDDHDWREGDGECAPEMWYEESDSNETIYPTSEPPTHWQPLPAPPLASTQEGETP